MQKQLTVVMPFLNEDSEPTETLDSLFATTHPDEISVVVIDDCSDTPDSFQAVCKMAAEHPERHLSVLRNDQRIGVDASRQRGVSLVTTPQVLIIDAHMRFAEDKDWLQRLSYNVATSPETVFCTMCRGLGYGRSMDDDIHEDYCGASLQFVSAEQDVNRAGEVKFGREVLEGKWLEHDNPPIYPFEVSCIMGANYAFNKVWFDFIHGLQGLQMWGTSEPFLSLKSWLAGGSCKAIPDVVLGHVFRDNAPFSTPVWPLMFNKLLLMELLLPTAMTLDLMACMPHDGNFAEAQRFMSGPVLNSWVCGEKDYQASIQKRTVEEYAEMFDLVDIINIPRAPLPKGVLSICQ